MKTAQWTFAMALAFLAAGCSALTEPEPELEGVCVQWVRLGGVDYVGTTVTTSPELVSAEVFGTVLRHVTCNDTVPLPDGAITDIREGDALGYAVGTTFHAVAGSAPTERLAYLFEGQWWLVERAP